jgi:predicted AAA+ superfamily ATPase
MINRSLDLSPSKGRSCFLWGPRQTGKSTLLKNVYPEAPYYDLLLASEYRRLLQDPGLLRLESEALAPNGRRQREPIIIDEVQKIPELLDEVHWLIVNRGLRFVLSGSSPRKLKRGGGNLLGGRAVRFELMPLTSAELPDLSLFRVRMPDDAHVSDALPLNRLSSVLFPDHAIAAF